MVNFVNSVNGMKPSPATDIASDGLWCGKSFPVYLTLPAIGYAGKSQIWPSRKGGNEVNVLIDALVEARRIF